MSIAATQADVESRLKGLGKTRAGVDPADIAEVVESVLSSNQLGHQYLLL